MAIDPKAAAAAAQAAADAARTAAEAAAAAAAAATATTTAAPTLAATATRQVLGDTGVTLGTELGGDAAALADLGHEESALADQERGGFAALPGLTSSLDAAGGLELPTLEGSFSSGGGDLGKSSIMDGGNPPLLGILDGKPWTGGGSPTGGGSATGGGGSGGSTTGGVDWGGLWDDTKAAAKADYETSWMKDVVDFFTGDDDTSTSTDTSTEGSTTGGGASTPDAGDVPAEDAPFNPPPGWIDPDDLDFVSDDRKIGGAITGSRGGDPDADDTSTGRPRPQGGDWAVNPGSEGTMYEAGRNTDLRDATAATWVGQPAGGDENLPEQMPAELQALEPGPGPEVINPDRGDADSADSEAQASTAFAADQPESMPMADDADAHRGDREFGQEQGRGRGQEQPEDEEV